MLWMHASIYVISDSSTCIQPCICPNVITKQSWVTSPGCKEKKNVGGLVSFQFCFYTGATIAHKMAEFDNVTTNDHIQFQFHSFGS